MAKIVMLEEASVPASPSANQITLYTLDADADADKVLYSKNPGGGVRVASNIPPADATHDLGATAPASRKWRDLFLSRDATIGGTLTVASSVTVTNGALAFTAANSNIIAGPTSLSIRDSTNSFNNLALTDAGVGIFRGGLTVSAGAATLAGTAYIGDTSNAFATLGLTVNQGAADDEILALKSSDVAHGMTSNTETDTYGTLRKYSATDGGVQVTGYSETQSALVLNGTQTTEGTTKNAGAVGAVQLHAWTKSGTTFTDPGANANLVVIRQGTSSRFIFDAEGDFYYDGSTNVYDAYDDIALVRGLDLLSPGAIRTRFDGWVTTKKDDLVAAGILGADGPNGERGMVNLTGLTRLQNGALWQLAIRVTQLEERLALLAGA